MLAVCKATGWESELIPRIGTALGGGVGRQGEVCGAVTGGVLVIGLVHGRDRAEELEAKDAAHAKAAEFVQRLAGVIGSVRCRDLIDLDLSHDRAIQEYLMRNLHETCSGIVASAVQMLLELLAEWETEQPGSSPVQSQKA